MRLLGFISLGLLACVGSSCADSSCGPTSDWPRCNHDDGAPTSGGGNGGGKGPPSAGDGTDNPSTGGGPRDEAEKPPTIGGGESTPRPVQSVDAGASVPLSPDHDSGAATPLDDAGVDAGAGDGSVDAGAPPQCTVDSDARDAGSCYGIYCGHTPARLQRSVSLQGACLGSADLSLVCDGELTRVVSACAQDDVLMLGLGNTVSTCARNTPSLATASTGCIDCYVDDTLCALQQCLAPCIAGLSEACTSCRSEQCGAAFRACSGLPRP